MAEHAGLFCYIKKMVIPVLKETVAYILVGSIFRKHQFAVHLGESDVHCITEVDRMINKEGIHITILVVIKKIRLRGITVIIEAIFSRFIGEGQVMVVDV